ncbi:hypothetical protein JY651_27375 [Pyxidicoccus parkwayensis]|jgi:hypothetical protein|uniref:Lipoprotein n=1 Tax=Pyxidicoccus parkwayensis TaxID=2813578 RepID=A0ABX7NNM7_9BACT|nr:hypothetical protein [Pyxidicoccus parkwaysis]QSQ19069.1 hypothetical protein JY651_27375 [Pyxidicoccus parkwaysis]
MKKLFSGVMLAAGLVAAGCGGTEAGMEMDEASNLSTREDAVVMCSDKNWRVNFYAEPELINVVGTMTCKCWQPRVDTGIVTQYQKLLSEFTCSLD